MSLRLLVLLLALGCASPDVAAVSPPRAAPTQAALQWFGDGQASYGLDDDRVVSSPDQRPVPIASVAKVMTAYVVARRLPVGATLEVDAADVADTDRRRGRGESVVTVVRGEVLTRDQALTALLLPSANNVAAMLAERVAGSRSAFVALMRQAASELGMAATTYTDPSGFDAATVSTARDQVVLLRASLRVPVLARLMGLAEAPLPVVGRVRSTDGLLGTGGFVAGKTGSTSAAGGCLVFRVVRGGRVLDGAVLGQRGGRMIEAAERGAVVLADQVLP